MEASAPDEIKEARPPARQRIESAHPELLKELLPSSAERSSPLEPVRNVLSEYGAEIRAHEFPKIAERLLRLLLEKSVLLGRWWTRPLTIMQIAKLIRANPGHTMAGLQWLETHRVIEPSEISRTRKAKRYAAHLPRSWRGVPFRAIPKRLNASLDEISRLEKGTDAEGNDQLSLLPKVPTLTDGDRAEALKMEADAAMAEVKVPAAGTYVPEQQSVPRAKVPVAGTWGAEQTDSTGAQVPAAGTCAAGHPSAPGTKVPAAGTCGASGYDVAAAAREFRRKLDAKEEIPEFRPPPSSLVSNRNTRLEHNEPEPTPVAAMAWLESIDSQRNLQAANCKAQWQSVCENDPAFVLKNLKWHLLRSRKRMTVKNPLGLLAAQARRFGKIK
jgi:hypothetical protein